LVYVFGLVQVKNVPPSREHANVRPICVSSLPKKLNVALVLVVGFDGPSKMDVVGGQSYWMSTIVGSVFTSTDVDEGVMVQLPIGTATSV
jgi:hypothetical protein